MAFIRLSDAPGAGHCLSGHRLDLRMACDSPDVMQWWLGRTFKLLVVGRPDASSLHGRPL